MSSEEVLQPIETTSQEDGQAQEKGFFQCGSCNRHYTRVDHLARHVRSHTKEKPYTCEICRKSFARPDLLKRHVTSHDLSQVLASNKRSRQSDSSPVGRVGHACKACAFSKLKCEDQKPCRRCIKKSLHCVSTSGQAFESTSTDNGHSDLNQDLSTQAADNVFLEVPAPSEQQLAPATFPSLETSMHVQDNMQGSGIRQPVQFPGLDGSGVLEVAGTFFPDFLYDVMIPTSTNQFPADPPGYLSQAYTPRGFMDYGFEGTLDLDGFDFGFLSELNPKEVYKDRTQNEESAQDEATNSAGIGAEAFGRSTLVRWTPRHRDHGFAEQENLTLPADAAESPELQLNLDKVMLKDRLSLSARDKILAMVIEGCRPSSIANVVASFPSMETLDSFIQSWCIWHWSQLVSWLHLPTFKMTEKRPEVLTTLAAAGALMIPIAVFRKLGFALQEAVRLAIPRRFEEDNTTTRELQILQAYVLQLDIGQWSGNRRKSEIAESFGQPCVTMLRRAHRFHRSGYRINPPTAEDDDDTIHQKWLTWTEQESMKRLIFHVIIRDAQVSMCLNVNPLISYAEVNLPFPASRNLWEAENAMEWKERYLSQGVPDRLPSLVKTLRDLSQITRYQNHIDIQFTALIILHGIWGLVWEYHQFHSLSQGSAQLNMLVLSSRHQELCQIMQHFRLNSSEWLEKPHPQVTMLLELVSMHLYMSLEELQLYAGKEDKEAARKVNDSARRWIDKSDSRQAVWHAGQVIHAAKSFPKGQLRDFYAIAVYHASLCFWSYGVVSRIQQAASPGDSVFQDLSRPSRHSPTIWLDGPETAELQKFVTLRRGEPGIKYMGNSTLLSDSMGTMMIARYILRDNFGDELPPPLVENLSQLLYDLGQAARVS